MEADSEGRKSPGSCGLAAETDLSVNLLISVVSAHRKIAALVAGGIGIDRGQESDLIGTDGRSTTEEVEIPERTKAETGIEIGVGIERGDEYDWHIKYLVNMSYFAPYLSRF